MRILIVEDETTLNQMLSESLKDLGFKTDEAESIKDARYFLEIRHYDLILLDRVLPDGDSLELISEIREMFPKIIIIVLSAKDDKEDEIRGLNAGADDYITKPFDFDVLVARINARFRLMSNDSVLNIGDLTILPDEEKVSFKGKDISLKGKPFEVLTHLAKHRDQIISKEQLLDAIWEEPELVTPNVIEVAINQIRQKIDKALGITTIETVRRRGYRFIYKNEKK